MVVIYTRNWCGYCVAARRLLKQKGVTFETRNASDDPEYRAEMMERSGRRTFPQVFVGDRHVGGYDDLAAMDRSGELDTLLSGECS
jgi:glutaredoxin 3